MSELADGTGKHAIDKEQFLKAIDHPMPKIFDLLEECYCEHDYSALLSFLEYYSNQPDWNLAFIMTKDGGTLTLLR